MKDREKEREKKRRKRKKRDEEEETGKEQERVLCPRRVCSKQTSAADVT